MSAYVEHDEVDMLDVRGSLGIIYLAAPYSHADEAVMKGRVEKVTDVAGKLIAKGYVVFSPLTYTERIAARDVLPPVGWYEFDMHFLMKCGAIVVLELDGWEDSRGIHDEMELAARLGQNGLPILRLAAGADPVEHVDKFAIIVHSAKSRSET